MLPIPVGDVLKIFDRLISLIKTRERNNRKLFEEHIDPLYNSMTQVHEDYLKAFQQMIVDYRTTIRKAVEADTVSAQGYWSNLLNTVELRKTELEPLRVKVHEVAQVFQDEENRSLPIEAKVFFECCLRYFEAASDVPGTHIVENEVDMVRRYAGHYSHIRQAVLAGEDVGKSTLPSTLATIKSRWNELSSAYATASKHLLK